MSVTPTASVMPVLGLFGSSIRVTVKEVFSFNLVLNQYASVV